MDDGATGPRRADDAFVWHPTYAGRGVDEVRAEIEAELRSDQRAYALALEGSERHENDALRTVVELERKWGPFDMDWAERDPTQLAAQVVAFELERERRRELIPVAAFREDLRQALPASRAASGASANAGARGLPAGLGEGVGRLVAVAIVAVVVVAIVVWLVTR